MEVVEESVYESEDENGRNVKGPIHEHSIDRRDNIYLVNQNRLNTFVLDTEGDTMRHIREESRQIYMVGNTPGIYFDLETSPTFVRLCSQNQPIIRQKKFIS